MAIAIHINYDTKEVSHVTGVDEHSLCISKNTPSAVSDLNTVKTGVVFEEGDTDQLKDYLTGVLALMASAFSGENYQYLDGADEIGADLGDAVAFYHAANGTTHVTLSKLSSANDAEPRLNPYAVAFNLDGAFNEANTAAKKFYDDLTTKKNLL